MPFNSSPSPSATFQGLRHLWQIAPSLTPTAVAQLQDLPPLIARLLISRGVRTKKEAANFFEFPDDSWTSPSLLPDMEKALERLDQAKRSVERTAVYGDFDSDGVTGTALLVKAFKRFGLNTTAYIPHRVTEGHGLNVPAIDSLHSQGVRLIVTVDCGVTDVEAIAHAKALGVDVIVTDHHLTAAGLPDAVAIINPHAAHSKYPFQHLTGAGMTLKLAQALLAPAFGPSWAEGLLELAAIGTITDMAPLLGENRHIVARGIEHLRQTSSVGLIELMRAARVDPAHADATSIGFAIGPRLNAAGRLDHAGTAYELLVTDDAGQARTLVAELDDHNSLRQALTQETLDRAGELIPAELPPVIVIGDASFNPGVIGLVAGKLVEQYGVPAAVYALDGDKVLASCRSGPGFHWADALKTCSRLLLRHGGHAQAAGFTCHSDSLADVQHMLEAVAAERSAGVSSAPMRIVDAEVSPAALMGRTFHFLQKMEPFGVGNPHPLFLSRGVRVDKASTMGSDGQHIRLTLRCGGAIWEAMGFRQTWTPGTEQADIVYSMTVDRWNGRERLRLLIEDYAPSRETTRG